MSAAHLTHHHGGWAGKPAFYSNLLVLLLSGNDDNHGVSSLCTISKKHIRRLF